MNDDVNINGKNLGPKLKIGLQRLRPKINIKTDYPWHIGPSENKALIL